MATEEAGTSSDGPKSAQLLRCMDWLQKQNNQEIKKSLQNKNDIQFIIQMNADRKKFLLSAAEDEATVPSGVLEPAVEPAKVPVRRLKTDNLRMECDWQACRMVYSNYDEFQKHVATHCQNLHVIERDGIEEVEYVCLWDVCGHKTSDFREIVRHINYHAYHTKLMAVGFNARATLKLLRCRKDSKNRNLLPPLKGDHICMWTGCGQVFESIQKFFDHMKQHVNYSKDNICSWAGCGATFPRPIQLGVHVASHTGERQIACFHCGHHFANNRKLTDHLRRQNVTSSSPWSCSMCGKYCATEYLLNEHSRLHVSMLACALCDMTAQTPAALAQHVRYRHLSAAEARTHACTHCHYKAITKSDLRKHTDRVHNRKKKRKRGENEEFSDNSDISEPEEKKPKRQYACHLCPEKVKKVFTRGSKLTKHLVNKHEAQWPFGYSRFRYQICEDGMYRLTTTRYEVLEVSKKVVDGYSGPIESLTNNLRFTIKQTSEATETTPKRFEIVLKGAESENEASSDHSEGNLQISEPDVVERLPVVVKTDNDNDIDIHENPVEILLCDVDEKGNIIKSEVLNSDAVYR